MKIQFIIDGRDMNPPPNTVVRVMFEEDRHFEPGEVMEITVTPPEAKDGT